MTGKLMNEEQKRKYDLCRGTLSRLLRETMDNQHYVCEFFVDKNGAEWVDITFDNEYRVCKVNVTSANLLSLATAVLKHLGG